MSIPAIDPEKMIRFVLDNDTQSKIDLGCFQKASEISCPNCHGNLGFYNLYDDAWACSNSDCLDKWKLKKFNSQQFIKIPVRGLLDLHKQIFFEHCYQDQKYLAEWKSWLQRPTESLLFSGASGNGKTYAAVALLKEICKKTNLSGWFINISDLYPQWRETFKENKQSELKDKICETDIVVFDDIGNRTPTDSFLDFLYLVIDNRINNNKKSIYTTNLNYEDMKSIFGGALTSRITFAKIYKFYDNDRRTTKN